MTPAVAAVDARVTTPTAPRVTIRTKAMYLQVGLGLDSKGGPATVTITGTATVTMTMTQAESETNKDALIAVASARVAAVTRTTPRLAGHAARGSRRLRSVLGGGAGHKGGSDRVAVVVDERVMVAQRSVSVGPRGGIGDASARRAAGPGGIVRAARRLRPRSRSRGREAGATAPATRPRHGSR